MTLRTIAEINDKISRGQVVAWTVEEVKAKIGDVGITEVAKQVDVVTTGTFEPMESPLAELAYPQLSPR